MSTLIAYHNKPETKDFYIKRMEGHMLADQLIQGKTWESDTGKGCAVGCTLHTYDHKAYERELGWPQWLARMEDRLFEGQSKEDAKEFPLNLMQAVPVGFTEEQFNLVKAKFFHWILVDPEVGVLKYARTEKQQKVISDVGALYEQVVNGQVVEKSQWQEARAYAADAAYAAYTAADAAAAYAADAYAAYAAYAAAAAADADAYAAAADAAADAAYAAAADADADAYAAAADAAADAAYAAARQKHFKLMADKLVSLFEAA